MSKKLYYEQCCDWIKRMCRLTHVSDSEVHEDIIKIATIYGIPCEDTQDGKLTISDELYQIIESYYANHLSIIKAKKQKIDTSWYKSSREMITSFGLRPKQATPERLNQLHMLLNITPIGYRMGYVTYDMRQVTPQIQDCMTKEQLADYLATSDLGNITTPDLFRRALARHMPEAVLKLTGTFLYRKSCIDILDYSVYQFIYGFDSKVTIHHTIVACRDNKYSLHLACRILGIRYQTATVDARVLTLLKCTDGKYCCKTEVDKWYEFLQRNIAIKDLIETDEFKSKLIFDFDAKQKHYIVILRKNCYEGLLDDYGFVSTRDNCLGTTTIGTVLKDKQEQVIAKLVEFFNEYYLDIFAPPMERLDKAIDKALTKSQNKQTLELLRVAAKHRLSTMKRLTPTTYVNFIIPLLANAPKEITRFTELEIGQLIEQEELSTRQAKNEFIYFLNHVKNTQEVEYRAVISINQSYAKERKDVQPYKQETFFQLGCLICSNTHIWYKEYLEKATTKRVNACIWLYAAMHFVSAWRRDDILASLPRPTLPLEPSEIIKLIRTETLPKEMAVNAALEVEYLVSSLDIKPQKTEDSSPPHLVLQIPESTKEFYGMLFLLCTAHYEEAAINGETQYLTHPSYSKRKQLAFFGKPFKELLDGKALSNRRANKSYLNLIAKNGEELNYGTGYTLASVARSHKIGRNKELADTTNIYLKYFNDTSDLDLISNELFERGVCSYIPYLLLKTIKGKNFVEALDFKEQTKLLQETIEVSSHEVEQFSNIYANTLTRVKKKVQELITQYQAETSDIKGELTKVVTNIATDNAPSKVNNLHCLITARGQLCPYPEREQCIGCGNEIYTKLVISELGAYIYKHKEKIDTSLTNGSKLKNTLILNNVLVPIVQEIITTLKMINPDVNMLEYKELLEHKEVSKC